MPLLTALPPRPVSRWTPFAATLLCALLSACASGPAYTAHIPTDAQPRPAGEVLIVLSAAPIQTLADGSTRKTGYFLNEFYGPYQALIEAGYQITIATPGGRPPALDPESLKERYWEEAPEALARAQALIQSLPQMQRPAKLKEIAARAQDFQALVVPGGQGVMVDLLDDPTLHTLVRDFGASHRPVGLICHAPALLTRMPAQGHPFIGRRLTSVSGFEEWYIETFVMDADAQVRGIGDRLEEADFEYTSGFPGRANAERDCNLVTSQNPFSGEAFNALFIEALMDWRRGGRCVPNHEG